MERSAFNQLVNWKNEKNCGELARILIYELPLSNSEMKTLFEY